MVFGVYFTYDIANMVNQWILWKFRMKLFCLCISYLCGRQQVVLIKYDCHSLSVLVVGLFIYISHSNYYYHFHFVFLLKEGQIKTVLETCYFHAFFYFDCFKSCPRFSWKSIQDMTFLKLNNEWNFFNMIFQFYKICLLVLAYLPTQPTMFTLKRFYSKVCSLMFFIRFSQERQRLSVE